VRFRTEREPKERDNRRNLKTNLLQVLRLLRFIATTTASLCSSTRIARIRFIPIPPGETVDRIIS
jgi:hypothetical protein